MRSPDVERSHWNAAATANDVLSEMWSVPGDGRAECMTALLTHSVLDVLDRDANAVLVEIGCGMGRLANTMAQTFPRSVVVGVDISEALLRLATEESADNTIWQQTDGRDLVGCRNGEATLVYSVVVFQHLEAEAVAGYIAEAGRVLMPGGVFRFQFVEAPEPHDNGPYSHALTIDQVETWLSDAGMETIERDRGLLFDDWTWITAIKEA